MSCAATEMFLSSPLALHNICDSLVNADNTDTAFIHLGSSGLPTFLTHTAFLHASAMSFCHKCCAGAPAFEVPEETGKEIIDKFRLQQGLLLTVRPEQPINLSIEQLRRLSWEEHSGVWRDYVNALAQCLVRLPVTMQVSMLHNKSWTSWVVLSCTW